MNSLFFSHIPKTAGTSLRKGAVKCWGKGKVLFDYGDSEATSDCIKTLLHDQQDLFALKELMAKKNVRMLSAHKPAKDFYAIFKAHNIFTFVRDPVERVISHYQFFCKHFNYNGSLKAFAADPVFANVHAQFFDAFPLELYGFIGIQERYDESLRLFNSTYNCKLPILNLNQGASIKESSAESCDQETRDWIKHHNKKDIQLYQVAEKLFDARVQAQQNNHEFIHGRVQSITTNAVTGWATALNSAEPSHIKILVNEHQVASVSATEYRAPLKQRNAHRDGFIGFSHRFAFPLKPGDEVICLASKSEQKLGGAVAIAA